MTVDKCETVMFAAANQGEDWVESGRFYLKGGALLEVKFGATHVIDNWGSSFAGSHLSGCSSHVQVMYLI